MYNTATQTDIFNLNKPYSMSDQLYNGYEVGEKVKTQNLKIALEMACKRVNFITPEVGDILIIETGERKRIAHIWEKGEATNNANRAFKNMVIQPSDGGSFGLTKNGYAGMSGGLNSSQHGTLFYRGKELADFWFASKGNLRAHSGVYGKILTNVWSIATVKK